MYNRLWLALILIIFLHTASATENVTLNYPPDATSCIPGEYVNIQYTPEIATINSCSIYSNSSGVWDLNILNSSVVPNQINSFNLSVSPGLIIWDVLCSNGSDSFISANYTFTITAAPYCAFLTASSCPRNISVNSEGTFITRLGNTKGFWLENQDGNVFITNSRNEVVKQFNTMMINAETEIQIDKNGNQINVAKGKVPLTDSQGWYVFTFPVDDSWAWVGDEYTINAVLNGQAALCKFNVSIDRLTDMERYSQLGKAAGGMFVFWILLAAVAVYMLRSLYLSWRGK